MLNKIAPIVNPVLNLISVPCCIVCKADTFSHMTLCQGCWSDIVYCNNVQTCKKCGSMMEADDSGQVNEKKKCYACNNGYSNTGSIESTSCFVFYDGEVVPNLISMLKYNCIYSIGKTLGNSIAPFLHEFCTSHNIDYIVSVPLHMRRFAVRGFNQADMILRHVFNEERGMVRNLLLRTKNIRPQVGLDRQRRKVNVLSAFSLRKGCEEEIQGKNILIFDDVITTLSTANECAKILMKSGAAKCFALSFARSVVTPDSDLF